MTDDGHDRGAGKLTAQTQSLRDRQRADALRANLMRRKAQARGRDGAIVQEISKPLPEPDGAA